MVKGKLPLVIGVVLGIIAASIAYISVKKERERIKKGWEMGQILVARTEIKAGTKLTSDMLGVGVMPIKYIRDGMLKPTNRGYIIGQPVTTDIHANDPIFDYDIEVVNVTEGLSKMIQKGGRAVSLNIGGAAAVANWVRPNDHVDIIGVFKDPNTRQQMAMTLLEDVIVIATGEYTGENFKSATKDKTGQVTYNSITLYVLPQEAEILILAQTLGSLYLSLRNPDDLSSLTQKGRVTLDTIFTGDRTMQLKAIRRKVLQTRPEIIKGGTGR